MLSERVKRCQDFKRKERAFKVGENMSKRKIAKNSQLSVSVNEQVESTHTHTHTPKKNPELICESMQNLT